MGMDILFYGIKRLTYTDDKISEGTRDHIFLSIQTIILF